MGCKMMKNNFGNVVFTNKISAL